jgi:hypothetical protein
VESEKTASARQWLGKQVTAAANTLTQKILRPTVLLLLLVYSLLQERVYRAVGYFPFSEKIK